jgi:hypothetical protein
MTLTSGDIASQRAGNAPANDLASDGLSSSSASMIFVVTILDLLETRRVDLLVCIGEPEFREILHADIGLRSDCP